MWSNSFWSEKNISHYMAIGDHSDQYIDIFEPSRAFDRFLNWELSIGFDELMLTRLIGITDDHLVPFSEDVFGQWSSRQT
jgi:hypothetical protein